MKIDRKWIKKDGYIKNQYARLRDEYSTILWKILAIVLPVFIFTAILWGLMSLTPSPLKWEKKEITFLSVTREHASFAKRKRNILNTVEGEKYIIPSPAEKAELLSQKLIPYQRCDIVYSGVLGFAHIQSLSSDHEEYIILDESIEKWEKDRQILYIITAILLIFMILGSVWSYFCWCKSEHQRIAKIKSKIMDRLNKKVKNKE